MSITSPEIPYRERLVDLLLDHLLTQLPGLQIVGPRAAGKTRTFARRAATVIRLNAEADAAAFKADPDSALQGLAEPVLLDEWQEAPGVLGAVRRAIDADPRPNRYYLTGSVNAELETEVHEGTGRIVRFAMHPMSIREQIGDVSAPSFFDRLAAGDPLGVPVEAPNLRGYIELALASGFPFIALRLDGRARRVALDGYLESLLTRDIEQFEENPGRRYDRIRLRNYFEAYALNSGSVCEHTTIYSAAQINRLTANTYEDLLTNLFVVDQVPAWATNRLKRLVRQPKRYVVDAALIAAALRMDAGGILRDGNLLGRMLDTFVAAQLRPEVLVSDAAPRLYHLRTEQGRHEIDVIAELGGGRVIGMEIKASAAPERNDAKHLLWLREELGDAFVAGVVFHTGPRLYELDERIVAAPISALWG
jgi:predicted AAA+ superfamily ATPase